MYANEKVLGKYWGSADRAQLVDFGDCARAELFWNDGGYAYYIEDNKADAIAHLERLGFKQSVA